GRIDPWIIDIDFDVVFAKLAHDIDNTRVAQVRALLFECQTHKQDLGTLYLYAPLGHGLDQLRDHIFAHSVIKATACQDNFRVIADGLRLVRQVVRIHAYAVAADQTGAERQEVPLSACRFQYSLGIDTQFIENKRQLIDE